MGSTGELDGTMMEGAVKIVVVIIIVEIELVVIDMGMDMVMAVAMVVPSVFTRVIVDGT